MSLPYQRVEEFIQDFDLQYRWYFEHADEKVAERFLAAVEKSLSLLAAQPEMGKCRKFRHPKLAGVRSFRVQPPFDRILIFYRFAQGEIQAWRLMDGSRDLPRRLAEPPE